MLVSRPRGGEGDGAPIERKPLTLPYFGELDSSTITAISIVLILAGLIGVAMQAMGLI